MLVRRLLLAAGGGSGGFDVPIPDVREYMTTPAYGNGEGETLGGPDSSLGFTALEDAGNSLYARVIKSTVGLMHLWPLGIPLSTWGTRTTEPPYFANAAGPTTLWTPSGTVSPGATLVAGGAGSADLAGGYLEAFDARAMSSALEWMSAEMWVQFDTLAADVGLIGEWEANDGWLLYTNAGTDLRMYVGDGFMEAPGVLSSGSPLHIVGTFGGQQGPLPDYYSRLYVNGVDVAHDKVILTTGSTNSPGTRFQVGQYASGSGTPLDGKVQDVAIYSRMLQPDEIYQHYQAGLGVLWP